MGRGRQKAKQTKVARQLKYFSPDTDYDALARELHGDSSTSADDRTDGFGDELDDPDEDTSSYPSDHPVDEYEDWAARGRGA